MRNVRTKPSSASASVNAMAMNIVVWIRPAISGWRAMASSGLAADDTDADTRADGRETVRQTLADGRETLKTSESFDDATFHCESSF